MSVESSFNYLTRSYEKIYQEMKYIKKIKLTEKSDKNIRLHAFGKLNDLHDKKWDYKNNIADLNKELGKRGFVISNGYGDLKEKTFRIAHMADITVDEVKELLDNINDILGLEK